jgi:hypothetical protein
MERQPASQRADRQGLLGAEGFEGRSDLVLQAGLPTGIEEVGQCLFQWQPAVGTQRPDGFANCWGLPRSATVSCPKAVGPGQRNEKRARKARSPQYLIMAKPPFSPSNRGPVAPG